MKGRPVDQLVYECMFPKPRASDPPNFTALLQRHLVLEVRQEVHSFYGHLDTPEAKYPGLDYTHPTHRIRLSRWQWHRRLFRAFDALRLTPAEIAGLTKWEGTKWAKERYEREEGITIRDTTADGFPDWVDPEDRSTPSAADSHLRVESEAESREQSEEQEQQPSSDDANMVDNEEEEDDDDDNDDDDDEDEEEDEDEDEDEEEEEDSDGELESVGVALNERLRERVALRNVSGDNSMPLDEEWENWLKMAIESGELPHMADQIARFNSTSSTLTADDIFPPRMVAAARAGAWHEIPDFLHDMIRRVLDSNDTSTGTSQQPRSSAASQATSSSSTSPTVDVFNNTSAPRSISNPTRTVNITSSRSHRYSSIYRVPSGGQRRTMSNLRLPVGDISTTSAPQSQGSRTVYWPTQPTPPPGRSQY